MSISHQVLRNWQTYLLNKLWREPMRVFVAMSASALFSWHQHHIIWTIPLILGVVAAALADLDDRLTGRLLNIFITLLCFAIATVSVELLFPYPIAFCIGLAISSCGFILLGALGQRYATIAFGALLIAIYTMLGAGLFPNWYIQPLFLLIGACGYYLLTLISHILFPVRPVEEQLIHTYLSLANYLEAKAKLFDPDYREDNKRQFYKVSMANSQLVTQLNTVKSAIQSRIHGAHASDSSRRALLYYFIAQDIHERGNSSHVNYQHFKTQWEFTELFFRLERLLRHQADACRGVAESIRTKIHYSSKEDFNVIFDNIEKTLSRVCAQTDRKTCEPFQWLLKNLREIDGYLTSIATEQQRYSTEERSDIQLSFEGLRGWSDIKSRIATNLTPNSSLFRHAVRLSTVLCSGYIFIHVTELNHGYWILLTSLFVCQPNYSATRRRLALRIIGTLLGVLLGLPLLWLIPSVPGQLIAIVGFGVLFFIFRQIQYAQATLFITLMVLFSFNLLGEGFNIILPRVVDTLIGCGLAWIAVSYIFPDWRYRKLSQVIDSAYSANLHYLQAVIEQYQKGKSNHVEYRIARRNAHNTDANLASLVTLAESEVWPSPAVREISFSLLCLNHSLLSYISALGAHRQQLDNDKLQTYLSNLLIVIRDYEVPNSVLTSAESSIEQLNAIIEELQSDNAPQKSLFTQQISLITKTLVDLLTLRAQLDAL